MKFSRSLLAVVLASFLSILAVGCGSSNNDFVATGNNNGVVNPNGNLTFRFARALAQEDPQEVPADTLQLAFSLHSSSPASTANLVEVRLFPFAEVVTLEDVDPSVTLVVVTAIGPNDVPLFAYEGPATVVPGTTQEVNLGTGTPITFDSLSVTPEVVNVVKDGDGVQLQFSLAFGNGGSLVLPSFDAPAASFAQDTTVANISATGLVSTGVGGQNSSVTASYELFGTSRSDTLIVNTYCFEILNYDQPDIAGTGTIEDALEMTGRYVGPNGVVVNFNEGSSEFSNVTFALASAVEGVSIDANSGDITGTGVDQGTPISILVTYTDPNTNFQVTVTQNVFADNDDE